MKFCNTLLLTLALTGFGSPATAEALKVLDLGLDGDTRYYTIVCPDGGRSSVSMQYDIPEDPTTEVIDGQPLHEVCIFSASGKKCQPQWDLDAAAQASCSKF